jgi:putative FmdB family regulatory protein
MPVFEYKCSDCNSKYDIFHRSSVNQEEVECPSCHSKNHTKLFSSFSPSVHNVSMTFNDCSSGNCNTAPSPGGCASGMCGLN